MIPIARGYQRFELRVDTFSMLMNSICTMLNEVLTNSRKSILNSNLSIFLAFRQGDLSQYKITAFLPQLYEFDGYPIIELFDMGPC